MKNEERAPLLSIDSDLVGTIGYLDSAVCEYRVRAVYFRPKMFTGQLLDYQGPYLIIQNTQTGRLDKVEMTKFRVIE